MFMYPMLDLKQAPHLMLRMTKPHARGFQITTFEGKQNLFYVKEINLKLTKYSLRQGVW